MGNLYNALYPWDVWLQTGNKLLLLQGEHYACSTSSFMAQIRNAASARAISVALREVRKGKPGVKVLVGRHKWETPGKQYQQIKSKMRKKDREVNQQLQQEKEESHEQ